MTIWTLFLLALGLSMDAFAVSVTNSMCFAQFTRRQAVAASASFGIFQGLMPLAGYFLGRVFAQWIGAVDHWVAFVLLGFIGGSMLSDFFIALFAGGLYGVRTGLYCVLGLLAKAFVVDGVIEGINVRKKVTIVSSSPERITAFIRDSLHRGATIYDARGAYTGREEHVITTVLKRREAVLLRNFIRRADPKAFITIVNSSETIGKGFRAL